MAKVVVNLPEVKADLHKQLAFYCVPGPAALQWTRQWSTA